MTQTLHALLQSVGLPVPHGLVNPVIESLTCDSRNAGPGSLFVGLPGERPSRKGKVKSIAAAWESADYLSGVCSRNMKHT